MPDTQLLVETIHQLAGYPTAFLLAPLALATWGGARGHRGIGLAFVSLMCFLYATGLFMSLTRHEFGSRDYFRNLAFNFFGFYALLLAVRSIYLFRHPEAPPPCAPGFRDGLHTHGNRGVDAGSRRGQEHAHAGTRARRAGLHRDRVEGTQGRFRTARRTVCPPRAYMLTTFLYVLTVASIVHLGEELPRNTRWLWPTALGMLLVPLASSRAPALGRYRRGLVRFSARAAVAVALSFGAYAMFELATGRAALGGRAM
ncbi:MAG: hypothetical protein M5U09_20730 [Gammaproteobacteria bacterium]|nr:hypothetical protein [Gammaproteobacteria bacterium]